MLNGCAVWIKDFLTGEIIGIFNLCHRGSNIEIDGFFCKPLGIFKNFCKFGSTNGEMSEMVDRDGLENRRLLFGVRGFESLSLLAKKVLDSGTFFVFLLSFLETGRTGLGENVESCLKKNPLSVGTKEIAFTGIYPGIVKPACFRMPRSTGVPICRFLP